MLEITTIIAVLAGLIIIFPMSWFAGKNSPITSSYRVLDLAVTSFILFFIIARVLGMIYFREGLPVTWTLLPLSQPDATVEFFQTWPWKIFDVTDGRFLFVEGISAYAIAELVFIIVNGRRMRLSRQIKVREQALAIFLVSLIPLFVVAYINDYLAEAFEVPYFLIIAILNLVAAILAVNLYKDQVRVKAIVLGVHIAGIIMFNNFYQADHSLVLINVILIGLLLFNIAKYVLEIIVVNEDRKKIVRNITSELT